MTQSDLPTPAASPPAVTLEQLQADLIQVSSQMSALQPSSSTAPTQSSGLCSFFGACTSIPSDTWYCGQTALHSPLVSDTTWVLDSGATEHMTPLNSRFVSYQRYLGGRSVLTTGGGRLPVAGIGAVYVAGLGVVQHVLHVPALPPYSCRHSALLIMFSAPFISNLTVCLCLTRWGGLHRLGGNTGSYCWMTAAGPSASWCSAAFILWTSRGGIASC